MVESKTSVRKHQKHHLQWFHKNYLISGFHSELNIISCFALNVQIKECFNTGVMMSSGWIPAFVMIKATGFKCVTDWFFTATVNILEESGWNQFNKDCLREGTCSG